MEYKWTVLTNTTLGGLMSSINMTIVLISLPAIFSGLNVSPFAPGEFIVLLWILMGYSIVTSTLLVTLGRLSDIFGRTKLYTTGFIVFTIAAILLSLIPSGSGNAGAWSIVFLRLFQGVGGALLMVNSTALITDAFPSNERGKALGINTVSFMAGSLIGLILGGLLANVDWHWVFIVNIPFGIAGAAWSVWKLKKMKPEVIKHIDLAGNITFAVSLVLIAVALSYTLMPYDNSSLGWSNPFVLASLAAGFVLLVFFIFIERRAKEPMFNLALFRLKPFSFGNLAGFLSSLSRGAIMFLVVIWLQGVYLPLHGISISNTPFWAAIYMIPMMLGFIILGPISGYLTDKFGARPFATGGLLIVAASLFLLTTLPYNFNPVYFELILFLNGIGSGMFGSPNTTAIMNTVPFSERGSGNGMRTTLNNLGQTISMVLFFTIAISIFTIELPSSIYGLSVSSGLPKEVASQIASLSPSGLLFSAFLGVNPIRGFIASLPANETATIPNSALESVTKDSFVSYAIAPSFIEGLRDSMYISIVLVLIGAFFSALRGGKFISKEAEQVYKPK